MPPERDCSRKSAGPFAIPLWTDSEKCGFQVESQTWLTGQQLANLDRMQLLLQYPLLDDGALYAVFL